MYWVLLMVVVIGSASFGQVDGPWTIWEGEGLPEQHGFQVLAESDSVAQIYYQINAQTWLQAFDVRTGEVQGWPSVLEEVCAGYSRQLDDAIWLSDGWAVMTHDEGREFGIVRLVCDMESGLRADTLGWEYILNREQRGIGNWNSGRTITSRSAGGYMVAWSVYDVIEWCYYSYFYGAVYGPDGTLLTDFSPCPNGGPGSSALAANLIAEVAPDSLVTLMFDGYGVCACFHETEAQTPETWCVPWGCPGRPVGMVNTDHGRWFFVTTRWTDYDGTHDGGVYEVHSTGCDVIDTLASIQLAAASHEERGLVWVFVREHGLYLQRLDTSGVPGIADVLYRPDANHEVLSADMSVSESGEIFVAWSERSTLQPDVTRIRIAALDWDTPLAVEERNLAPTPVSFSLSAYPNPFNSELRIWYEVAKSQDVSLLVYDLTGREVATLYAGMQSAGKHDVSWNAGSFSSGVYFVRLFAEEGSAVEKVLLMK